MSKKFLQLLGIILVISGLLGYMFGTYVSNKQQAKINETKVKTAKQLIEEKLYLNEAN